MRIYEIQEFDSMASNWGEYEVTKRFTSKAKAEAYLAHVRSTDDANWKARCGRDEPYPYPAQMKQVQSD